MNFSVYNTQQLNNIPESGIYSTYYSSFDGTSFQYSNMPTLHVDDQYIYFPVQQHSYISKNISTIGVLDTQGNLISRIEPNIPAIPKILTSDENYIYFSVEGFRIKNNANATARNVFRFNKNTYKIDSNFCLGSWNSWSPIWMSKQNNKYYLTTSSNASSTSNQIYPNLGENSTEGIYIIKNNQNIANFGRINTNSTNRIKVKDGEIYIAGRTANLNSTVDYSKLFKINKNNIIDTNFYPIIERINSTAATAIGASSSDVFDFDFDNQGIYIGGNFLTVGGEIRTGLAKIDYSGNLISGFNANLSATNNTNIVRAVLTTGSGLFVGGTMSNAGGSTGINARIVKLHNDGSLNTGFSGRLNINYCSALAISGNNLYAGANLNSSFGGGITYGLAKMNSESGNIDSNFSVSVGTNSPINKILVSGENIYVCSDSFNPYDNFNNALQHYATGVIKLRASDGNPDTGFKINFTPHAFPFSIQDMFIKGNELHIVGNFTGIEGRTINNYAIVDTVSGRLLDTKSYFGGQNFNRAIAYDQNQDRIIICGSTLSPYFSGYNFNYNSKINVFDNNFNILTGIQFTGAGNSFNINSFTSVNNDQQILFNNTTGYINSGNAIDQTRVFIRSFNMENGNMLDINNFYLSGNNSFLSAVKYNNDYYFGGSFNLVSSSNFTGSMPGVVKTNINGTIDTSFNLSLTGTSTALVRNLKIIDNNLYILGNSSLTGVSGIAVNNFVKYNLLNQTIDTGFNTFLNRWTREIRNVHNDNQNNLYFIVTTTNDTSLEYTGSNGFENSGHLFKFDSGSYTPNMDFSSKYFILSNDILIDNDKIYAPLRNINKTSGSNIYKINKKTREISNSRVSIIPSGIAQPIYDMYGNDTSLYVCGSFTGINGIARSGVCKLNKSDLSLDTSFSLNSYNATTSLASAPAVQFLEKDNYLYIMGGFTRVNNDAYTGVYRINKSNDSLDTAFKIDYSGMSLNTTIQAAISGKNMYLISSQPPNFRVLDLDQGRFIFTGDAESTTTSLYGIVNTNKNLFLCGFSSPTKIDSRLVGARGRGVFIAGYNSGELLPPYSAWNNNASFLYTYANYLPINNTVVVSTTNSTINQNNTSNRSTNSIIFFDANKLYVKNKRNINWAVGLPTTIYPYVYVNSNEYYIIYSNWLFTNPDDNINYITNSAYTFGVVKYDPIKESYNIIV